jgi:toxin ParE1/3/4
MQVKWSRKALLNLDDAVEFIAADNPIATAKVAQQVWDAAQQLAAQPRMGRPGRVVGTRELVISDLPYVLPYVEEKGAVIILRVIHASM